MILSMTTDLTPGRGQPATEQRKPTGRKLNYWSKHDDATLIKCAPYMHVERIAERVNRSKDAVKARARNLGIKLLDSRLSSTKDL